MSNLPARFQNHLKGHSFFRKNDRALIACSGGPDSVALVRLLADIASQNRWRLGILHYDHRLRAGSPKDSRFVRDLARKLRLKFYGGFGNVRREAARTKSSIEEAARAMRYEFFVKTAKRFGIKKIVLAHTLNDQAETVLMRVLQGTGIRGLQGIRETHQIDGILFIRPLLTFIKKDLLEFLRSKKQGFRKDESNASTRFLRNRIRLRLIPVLQRDFNPRVVEALARIPAIAAEEGALIAELEKKAWRRSCKSKKGSKVELRRAAFLRYPPALQFRLAERALKSLDRASGLSFDAWERLRPRLNRTHFRCSLPRDIDLSLNSKKIVFFKKYHSA